ncbi:DUF736 family protein [Parvularcula sp. LCG005]|uniref:DUF736 family protein n=1 Tax=Parvularcula sp. LCG005 TaxID=3078805 RepID=UPI0029422409|nr:DUF736 family protein [Parvularcula sp. LCG005]WOI51960.1 DUF736 family protein [Parvularcula sp. LCG005]
MAKIGELIIEKTADGFYGKGRIRTMHMRASFDLLPVERQGDKAPSHHIVVYDGGEAVPIGAAWQNAQKRGDNAGAVMFSLRFEDPDFPDWAQNLPAYATSPDNSKPLAIMFDRSRNQDKGGE